MARIGIGDDSEVVAYDDAGGTIAARLWWMLDDLGHRHVRVLDGGIGGVGGRRGPAHDGGARVRSRAPLAASGLDANVIDREALVGRLAATSR